MNKNSLKTEEQQQINKTKNSSWAGVIPVAQGLYDPDLEKDACGVGFICHIKGICDHSLSLIDSHGGMAALLARPTPFFRGWRL
jgi:hypothetical protein